MTQAQALPGSAAEATAKADNAVKAAKPTKDHLEQAQKAQADKDALAAKAAPVEQKPTAGRIVQYIAPDRMPRVALITYVHPGDEAAPPGAEPDQEPANRVNLVIFGIDTSDNHLARQSALTPSAPGQFLGMSIPQRQAGVQHLQDIHVWAWPERV